ncbi:conjugal transfer protein TraI [Mucilaginibacter sp. AW1-7]|uniref:conjugal transfer protein TraI n=1 Tax=Mucilaginibacter sp. AW1-7 TaxID=3349874 RepID=UPI003F73CB1E
MNKKLRTYMVVLPLSAMTILVALPTGVNAQVAIAEVIKAAIKKVIKAIDLKIQRLQNNTIWLQNAQKTIENQLSKLKLNEISDWTEKQRKLYATYYDELVKVKAMLATYQRIKDLTETQTAIVKEYHWAMALFNKDKHFTPDELTHMESVYKGILEESIKNLDQIFIVVNSFKTQMSDAKRLELINGAATRMDANYSDLREFNNQNITLSVQRSRSQLEVKQVKQMYEIN